MEQNHHRVDDWLKTARQLRAFAQWLEERSGPEAALAFRLMLTRGIRRGECVKTVGQTGLRITSNGRRWDQGGNLFESSEGGQPMRRSLMGAAEKGPGKGRGVC